VAQESQASGRLGD